MAGNNMTIEDHDLGFKEIMKRLRAHGGKAGVKAGLFGGIATQDGTSIADYMTIHEYGSTSHPERPFLRTAVDANKEKYFKTLQNGLKKVIEKKQTVAGVMTMLGIELKSDIQKSITDFGLIDTGAARNAVAFEVKKGGGS